MATAEGDRVATTEIWSAVVSPKVSLWILLSNGERMNWVEDEIWLPNDNQIKGFFFPFPIYPFLDSILFTPWDPNGPLEPRVVGRMYTDPAIRGECFKSNQLTMQSGAANSSV